ncbi:2-hydroxyacid dehydrogenase [Pontibacter sp. G13]|uniref:2-hydroxyacid dehydrogenase n=1 Tax=Pontibacter sp. G13 TaxID=3074898 RepID=UPI00288C42CF|nr:2-hydroxyacid dehydrogenase [Pontibacter sp. G13]WNJ19449.1 2-hydroxyacid dehydrogenase [Pontibacter sp. G13]
MKVAFFSSKPYDESYFEEYNTGNRHTITYLETRLNPDTAELARNHDAVCAFVNDELHGETLRILHQLGIKLLAMRCAGYNNVDLGVAKELGIKVARVPAYSPAAVAEHAVALILTLNRKTHKAYNRVREGNFSLNRLEGFTLQGKTVGCIGTGKIGTVFCRIMLGFGCRVVAYDKYPNHDLERAGVEYLEQSDLFRTSDIIALNCPLLPDTHHLIREETIKQMKPGVMIINTSRGGLVNTPDALTYLSNHHIGSLGIDVYEQEGSYFFEDFSENVLEDEILMRLISFPNVLITSHQGFFTQEALEEITKTTLANLDMFEDGAPLVNEVR